MLRYLHSNLHNSENENVALIKTLTFTTPLRGILEYFDEICPKRGLPVDLPWTVLDTFDNDPDEMLSTWQSLVLDVVDRHAPLKSVRVKSMKKPMWLYDQILTAFQERDRLKKELEKGRILKASFNAARNKVVRLIEKVN